MIENQGQSRLETIENAHRLLDELAQSLARVLESMADQKPEAAWQALAAPPRDITGPDADLLWWEQPFGGAEGTAAWIGAPRGVWEHAGTLTLKAAGMETVGADQARNTWFEILGQAFSAAAQSMSVVLDRPAVCGPGTERAPEPGVADWATINLRFGDAALPEIKVCLSSELVDLMAAPKQEIPVPEPPTAAQPDAPESATPSRTMELLLDVDLPVSISFGKTQLPIKEVLKLTTGSIVELNRGVNEPVEVLVNRSLVARGEVVVVDGNYGVRIKEIASACDRLRSIR